MDPSAARAVVRAIEIHERILIGDGPGPDASLCARSRSDLVDAICRYVAQAMKEAQGGPQRDR